MRNPAASLEEEYARDLYRTLSAALCPPDTEITIQGGGVNWKCAAVCGPRFVSISCFRLWGNVPQPQYLASFQQEDSLSAMGRTSSQSDIVAAVARWLSGNYIEEMYRHFAFVDAQKRALAQIEKEAIATYPELASGTTRELCHVISDLYDLWFRAGDRSCRISFDSMAPLPSVPQCVFHWDDCILFGFQTDRGSELATVLGRWLCDHALPSQMRADFPDLSIGPLADYYEAGRGIEGEFLQSWDQTERFYQTGHFAEVPAVLRFIAEIRQAGYDRRLRAGSSMQVLIVSRSRRHGLRLDQPRIAFQFWHGAMTVHTTDTNSQPLSCPEIKLTPAVTALLEQLAAHEID